jgi:RHS repeat-associated protein
VIDLTYNYGATNNNGDVLSASYAGGGLSYTQAFTYDSLNRLGTAQENGRASWSQTNGYDRYGNRWIDLGGGVQSLYFNAANNRISGWSYDASGNLLNDTVHSYAHDAEGKLKTVDSVTAYVYDGEGHRVKKLVGENTRFVYGIGGQLVAEFDGSTGSLKKESVYGGATLVTIEPTAVNSNGTQYTTSDNLGSPRVITNSSAGIVSRRDYMPFGEELGAGLGGRTTAMGFSNSGDNNRKKFTGHERDTETGLDFAQARYYSNIQGRFTSPDPFAGSATIGNPQTFNRYVYCGNNPVNLTDPLGMVAQPGGRNLSNWSGGMAAEEASDGLSQWDDSPAQEQPAADEATQDASGSAGGAGTFAIDDGSNDGAGTAVTAESSPLGEPQSTETGESLAQRAATGLSNHPGLLEQIASNTASGVDVHIVACQAAKESNYAGLSQVPLAFKNGGQYISDAPGSKGEVGLLQIFPSTAGVSAQALKNVGTNVKAATSYLIGIKNHFNVDMRTALAIYNWGPGNFNKVDRDVNRIFSGSLSYADKILDCANRLYLPSDGNRYKVP